MELRHEELKLANKELLPEVIQLLEEGHTVTLRLRGFSMRPFLEDNRDTALITRATNIHLYDPVLAEVMPGRYVLHRIVSIHDNKVILRGDGNLGTEECQLSDIKGSIIGFYRKGRKKIDRTDGWKWRIYSWFWVRLLLVRRYLLFAFHPHIPQRLYRMLYNKLKTIKR